MSRPSRQLIQNLNSGETTLIEAPSPAVKSGHVLIETRSSLVSLGTEKMLVNFGQANLIQKARQQPDKVKQVLGKVQSDGLKPTLDTVLRKLDTPIPLGYSQAGEVIAVGKGVNDLKPGDRVISNGPHAEVVSVPKNLVARIPDESNDLNQMLYWEINTLLIDQNLNYTDKMSMAEGIEVRVPFLDKDLVELSTYISPELKLRGIKTKYILKKAMEQYLPHDVIYRMKSGFGTSVRNWITNDLKLKIEDILIKKYNADTYPFDAESLRNLIDMNQMGKINASYSIWGIAAILNYMND